jgi:CubicO group peptidase (beta-lactamase class C family)
MHVAIRIAKWLAIAVLAIVAGAFLWLYISPPALIRVAAGYSAKIVCSNLFIAGRDPDEVLRIDVQAPGHPILRLISIAVDQSAGTVHASLLGLFGGGFAQARENAGCATVPNGGAATELDGIPAAMPSAGAADWPRPADLQAAPNQAVAAILNDSAMAGPAMRAIVVVHRGQIVGERYGEGFSAETPLLGWSMTKTVNAAIIGTVLREGKLALDQAGLFEGWNGDERAEISLADLLAMSSGLVFNEDYGDVTDVTRMLYVEPDMAAFAAAKPLGGAVGQTFNYSSGTAVILSRIWQNAVGQAALSWPREKLFGPLGMTSAVLEADASGTFVGSSYMYATALDWARFGEFLLRDGVWNGQRLLPEGYVAFMRDPTPASGGSYGRGQVWLNGPSAGTAEGEDPDAGFDLPQDAFWMLGHDGQSTAIIPSKELVVVRLGLTPSDLGYKSQRLVEALTLVLP